MVCKRNLNNFRKLQTLGKDNDQINKNKISAQTIFIELYYHKIKSQSFPMSNK